MLEEAIRCIITRKGATHRECLRRKMLYLDCGVEITMGSMTSHCQLIHGINTEIDWDRLLVSQHENLPQAYKVRFLNTTNKCHCPVPGCPGLFLTITILKNNFNWTHWRDRFQILKENFTLYLN